MALINSSDVRMHIKDIDYPHDYLLEIISREKDKYILSGYIDDNLGITHYIENFKKDVIISITYKDEFIISKEARIIECHLSFMVNEGAKYKLVIESNIDGTR